MWGHRHSELHDYSARYWTGLVITFYLPRWQLWRDHVRHSLRSDSPYDTARFEQAVLDWEEDWCLRSGEPARPADAPTAEVARALHLRYAADVG